MQNCIDHKGATTDGYGVVKRGGKTVRAHRFAYCSAKGIDLEAIRGRVVMHACDNRLCVNPDHLSLGSHADNCADKVGKGRQARGERSGNSKLSDNQVRLIKTLFERGETNAEIARCYGVSAMCIGRIRNGTTWGHL